MSLPVEFLNMTVEEYLQAEESGDVRHEFVAGQVYGMVGASDAHNVIALNIATVLRSYLRGSSCRAYMNDMKVRVEENNCFYYPDVMVTCEAFDAKSFYKTSPILICEVLSPSTSEIDHREKLAAYRQLPSLRYYLIVHQDQQFVEFYIRAVANKWELTSFREHDQIELELINEDSLTLPVSALYEDVEF